MRSRRRILSSGAEDGPVVLYGVGDLVVARSGGVTLVTTRERAQELKVLLGRLPAALRGGGEAAPGEAEGEPGSREA